MRNEKGLTLLEVIIVLALIAIIGGIVAPSFIGATEKARLRSDIQSARVIQSALELYEMENGKAVYDSGDRVETIIEKLQAKGYISGGQWKPQSKGIADWVLDGGRVKVPVGSSGSLREIADQLSEQEQAYVS